MVCVPDMDVLCRIMIAPTLETGLQLNFMAMLFGGQIDANDFHYFGWNFQFMQHYFEEAGFMEVKKEESFGLFQDTSEFRPLGIPISLNAIAIK